ncbi:Uncharacterized protein HZ326_25119 [Fusarium oxysporum f. sp. albedinis]|nr:Uncharacterized protein HZ326_25119 [Fusarium oxysporum f. sp. albedinis]
MTPPRMQCGTRFPTMSRHQNNPFYTWFLFHFTSRMSNLPLSPSPAGFPPTTLTPCPTPPSSVFSRLSQPKTKNRRFVQEDLLARKGAKGRKSWIRSHGTFLVELNYQDLPIGHVWCCNRCDMRGTAEFFSQLPDLSRAHRITPASQSSESSPGDEGVIDTYSGVTPKRRRLE